MASPKLPRRMVDAIDASSILGVRAGAKSQHWYQAFRADPLGVIQIGNLHMRVRAVPVRGERLRDAVERAYALKYDTAASRNYVRGFRLQRRRDSTVEFRPRVQSRRTRPK